MDSTQESFAALRRWHDAVEFYAAVARSGRHADLDRLSELGTRVEMARLSYRAAVLSDRAGDPEPA